jgi:hypothetical protein
MMDLHPDGETDITKLIFAYRNIVNAPNKVGYVRIKYHYGAFVKLLLL